MFITKPKIGIYLFLQNQRLVLIFQILLIYVLISITHKHLNSNITFPGLITAPDRIHGNA